jgi:8-oxo-dGTP diphosphatase
MCKPRRIHGVIAVIVSGDRWLMIQRSDAVIAPRAWCFPGGTIEPNESQEQALVREVREELSLTVTPGRHVWTWQRPDGGLELSWWTATIVGGDIQPDPAEVRDFRWMTSAEIRSTAGVLPNNLDFIDHAEINSLLHEAG